ncbi:hypothetical protein BCR34DRAFT_592328 [Clohesyomyces aquaticus]|uniref:Uncharacterized protein n=1 Tax=Clohesyomyces aquaticus TaxID=1231657 RepID=A0A1Y1YTC5_9PLEO|nr:hypothetical protein BCR34DRAFT_592328 [Clohesyomyces aquaticus]
MSTSIPAPLASALTTHITTTTALEHTFYTSLQSLQSSQSPSLSTHHRALVTLPLLNQLRTDAESIITRAYQSPPAKPDLQLEFDGITAKSINLLDEHECAVNEGWKLWHNDVTTIVSVGNTLQNHSGILSILQGLEGHEGLLEEHGKYVMGVRAPIQRENERMSRDLKEMAEVAQGKLTERLNVLNGVTEKWEAEAERFEKVMRRARIALLPASGGRQAVRDINRGLDVEGGSEIDIDRSSVTAAE